MDADRALPGLSAGECRNGGRWVSIEGLSQNCLNNINNEASGMQLPMGAILAYGLSGWSTATTILGASSGRIR